MIGAAVVGSVKIYPKLELTSPWQIYWCLVGYGILEANAERFLGVAETVWSCPLSHDSVILLLLLVCDKRNWRLYLGAPGWTGLFLVSYGPVKCMTKPCFPASNRCRAISAQIDLSFWMKSKELAIVNAEHLLCWSIRLCISSSYSSVPDYIILVKWWCVACIAVPLM